MKSLTVILFCALFVVPCLAEEPAFAAKPSCRSSGNTVTISFALAAPADAEVSILDAKGEIVRRLAAGMVGKNAAEPFKKNSLAQELVWDGTDDRGVPAKGAAVRVRLGTVIRRASVLPVTVAEKKKPDMNEPAPGPEAKQSPTYYANNTIMLCGDPYNDRIYYRGIHWNPWFACAPDAKAPVQLKPFRAASNDTFSTPDRSIYVFHWGSISKYDKDWNLVPFAGSSEGVIKLPKRNSPELDEQGYGDGLGVEAHCVGLDGKFYQFCSLPSSGYARLNIWSKDGKSERSGVIAFTRMRQGSGIRVDKFGYLYVAVNGLPQGYELPPELSKGNQRNYYGTILKLKIEGRWADKRDPEMAKVPDAGKAPPAGLLLETSKGTWSGTPSRWGAPVATWGTLRMQAEKVFVPDVAAAIPGISNIMPSDNCTCSAPWFDMDPFGRLYIPDPAQSRIRIVDGVGNEISVIAKQIGDLQVAWPIRVACAKDSLAFFDAHNLRVVQAPIEYKATETCPIKD